MMRQTHVSVANDRDPAPEVKRFVGTIAELWRYPVKSMLGGTVSELMVTERGVLGDRAWAPAGLAWLADASEFAPCRFLRHERALRDMMAARPTLGGGPA